MIDELIGGHWIAYTDHQACSCCGNWIAYYENDYKFCPYCGEKMVESEVKADDRS